MQYSVVNYRHGLVYSESVNVTLWGPNFIQESPIINSLWAGPGIEPLYSACSQNRNSRESELSKNPQGKSGIGTHSLPRTLVYCRYTDAFYLYRF